MAVTINYQQTKQVQQLRPPPAGLSWKNNMEKQVKVNVSWNKRGVNLHTDRGMGYYFGISSAMPEKGSVAIAIEEKSVTPIRKR